MSVRTRTSAIAVHVEAAKRLLVELEQHAETALHALGQEGGEDMFLAAIGERDGILAQLDGVVDALSQERSPSGEPLAASDPAAIALFAEMAQAAAAALKSHDHLASQTRRERDRLSAVLHRTGKPDAVAHHYAASTSASPRTRTLSVTG
jgi:hypothetical protein